MNLRSSYRALRDNSKAAMLAAIEIYNKPQITYREECFSILLVNSWELLFKAILSKNKQRIYYPKERNRPYRTLTIQDSLIKAREFFPHTVPHEPVAQNIRLLASYRNNSVHFYNQTGFEVVIFGLAQTSIINYRDIVREIFGIDIADEMTLSLLPLSFKGQPDPISFLQEAQTNPPKNRAVAEYLREITEVTQALEAQKLDTSRFLTVFQVKLRSVKKGSAADLVVGVDGATEDADLILVEKKVDPSISHPLRQTEILEEMGDELKGRKFSPYVFQAIAWYYGLKKKEHLCWIPVKGGSPQYSNEVISVIKKLSGEELDKAIRAYRAYHRRRRSQRKADNTPDPSISRS